MSEQSGGRAAFDIMLYSLLRLALVAVLTAVIYGAGRLLGVDDFPLVVALGFGFIVGLPLGIWLFAPLRRRATADLAVFGDRRRRDRDQLQARLRGEVPAPDAPAPDAPAPDAPDPDAPDPDAKSGR